MYDVVCGLEESPDYNKLLLPLVYLCASPQHDMRLLIASVLLSTFGSYCNGIRVPIDYTNSTSNSTNGDSNIQRRFGGFWAIQNNAGPHNPNFQFPPNGAPKPARGGQPVRPQNSGNGRQNPARKPAPSRPQNSGNTGKRLPNQNSIQGPWHPSLMLRPGRVEEKYNIPLGKSIPVTEEVDEGKQAGKNPSNRSSPWFNKNNPRPKGRSARQAVFFPEDENLNQPPVFEAIRPSSSSTTENSVAGTSTASPCERSCPVTQEFNPICGTDGTTYTNMGRLKCAQSCGKGVTLLYRGSCRRKTQNQTQT